MLIRKAGFKMEDDCKNAGSTIKTLMHVENCKFFWSLSDFDPSKTVGEYMDSFIFSVSDKQRLKFCLRLYLAKEYWHEHSQQKHKQRVSISTILLPRNSKKSVEQLKITSELSIINVKNKEVLSQNSFGARKDSISEGKPFELYKVDKVLQGLKPNDLLMVSMTSLIKVKVWTNQSDEVTFIINEKKFAVKRNVLIANSPVFKTIVDTVEITDFSYEVFDKILEFIHTGQIINFEGKAPELIVASEKYKMTLLKNLCEQELISRLSMTNVVDMLAIANQYSSLRLKQEILDFLSRNNKEVIKTVLPNLMVNFLDESVCFYFNFVVLCYRKL